MDINMSLKDYLEELRLMEKQYGQEEGLYPLIYMLLKNCAMDPVSIRAVAKGHSADSEEGIELIKGISGFPDIVILGKEFKKNNINIDENINKMYGCVEVKKIGTSLLKCNEKYNIKICHKNRICIKSTKNAGVFYYKELEPYEYNKTNILYYYNKGGVNMSSGIYKFENKINHLCYIG